MHATTRTAPRCPEPECCYHGQASASSCACADDESELCFDCSGSGEGGTEFSNCRACKGSGEINYCQGVAA